MTPIESLIQRIQTGSIEPEMVAPDLSLDDFQCSTSKEDILHMLTSARNGTLHPLHTGTVIDMLLTQHAYHQPLELTVLVTPVGIQILPKHLGLILPLETAIPALSEGEYCLTCDELLADCNCGCHDDCPACGEMLSYIEQAHCKNCNMVFKPEPLPEEFFTPVLPTTAWHDAT
jgi:hypothetical protein